MNNSSRPLVMLFGYKTGRNDLVFVGRSGDIRLSMKRYRQTLIDILALCDGHRTLEVIRKKFRKLSDDAFVEIVNKLNYKISFSNILSSSSSLVGLRSFFNSGSCDKSTPCFSSSRAIIFITLVTSFSAMRLTCK